MTTQHQKITNYSKSSTRNAANSSPRSHKVKSTNKHKNNASSRLRKYTNKR